MTKWQVKMVEMGSQEMMNLLNEGWEPFSAVYRYMKAMDNAIYLRKKL